MSLTIDIATHANLRGHSVPTGLLIGGEWRRTGREIAVVNPADEQVIASVADGSPDDALELSRRRPGPGRVAGMVAARPRRPVPPARTGCCCRGPTSSPT